MKRYTLTFDNGPDPEITPRVLEILGRHGVKAQFYVLGKHVATPAGRACVERALAEGHVVGNHSYTHATPLGDDPRLDAVEHEIVATQTVLDPLIGALIGALLGVRLFRPFGGGGLIGPHLLSRAAADHLIERGYTCVLWTSVPHDWDDPHGWPARALADLAAHDHAVVVLHDIPAASLAELESFLVEATRLGYEATLELPESVLPIIAGVANASLDPITRGASR